MRKDMLKDDKDHKLTEAGAATRRGFLFSLVGGLAGAAGWYALISGSKKASAGRSGLDSVPSQAAATPIDNIFVPLRSSKRDLQKERP